MIGVLVCDDNAVVREGLAAVLDAEEDITVLAQAANGQQAIDEARRTRPDVAVLDVRMPGTDGITAAAALAPGCRVLMLTFDDDEETVATALRAGATGFLVHGQQAAEHLGEAVRRVHRGEAVLGAAATTVVMSALRAAPASDDLARRFDLTRREAEVIALLAKGLANGEIAQSLFVTRKTVKNHLHNAYAKLGVGSRAEAIALWLRGAPAHPTTRTRST